MSADTPPRVAGRRRAPEQASRRPSPITIASLVIPLLTVGALALVGPADPPDVDRAPTERLLARSSVVCPAALDDGRDVAVASAGLASGEVALGNGDTDPVRIEGGVGALAQAEPVVLTADGDLAPGLLATRFGGSTAVGCRQPTPEQWFTGVGAGAERSSQLSLTNPDGGPAVADVTVLGPDGPVDVPALRGVTVPGRSTRTYDLIDEVPMREALALHVVVTRGRLGAHVSDVAEQWGQGAAVRQWIPPQAEPATSSYLVGIAGTRGERVLTVANPGDDEVRVETRLVSADSEFVPAGAEEVRVRPGSVVEVDLTRLLSTKVARDAVALRVESTGPVTAGYRAISDGAATILASGERWQGTGAVALPRGRKRLVVVGATAPGVLTWRAWDAGGRALGAPRRVEVDPGGAHDVRLPPRAVLVEVEVERTSVVASVELVRSGPVLLPLGELSRTSQVPHVRPALR